MSSADYLKIMLKLDDIASKLDSHLYEHQYKSKLIKYFISISSILATAIGVLITKLS